MVFTLQKQQAWDIDQAIPLGFGLHDGLKWAPVLDEECGCVRAAVDTLNHDLSHLDGDCYIIFSTSCLQYFLLYRYGSHNKVMEKLAENLQSAANSRWERATTAESSDDQEQILQSKEKAQAILQVQMAGKLWTELQAAQREIAALHHRLEQLCPPKKVESMLVENLENHLGSLSVRTQPDLPNLCMAGMHDKRELSVEWTFAVGPCQVEASDFPGAVILDPSIVTSLRAAVCKLITGEIVCYGDLAVAWSDSAMSFHLLYRRGCKVAAQKLVCLLAIHLSASKAGLLCELARATARPDTH
ncbi:unnamed protein product [Polarella glacialis]|uniref:Uncharacterized protein n=1 Tax=Polarella glacialis TaxID=89957 RepID=A0A813GZ78_POLGL|nr:unnamed protein product [Polarella glacialis]